MAPRTRDAVKPVRRRLATGEVRLYLYHRATGVRILCEPGTPEFEWECARARGVHRPAPAKRHRDVYFIRACVSGMLKIGVSDDAETRFRALQSTCSEPLELLAVQACHERGALEKRLHDRFAADRSHGEWFRPSPLLLAYIADIARAAA